MGPFGVSSIFKVSLCIRWMTLIDRNGDSEFLDCWNNGIKGCLHTKKIVWEQGLGAGITFNWVIWLKTRVGQKGKLAMKSLQFWHELLQISTRICLAEPQWKMSKGFEPGSAEQNPNEKCQRDLLGAQARTHGCSYSFETLHSREQCKGVS